MLETMKQERNAHFERAVQRLKDEQRYRVFIDLDATPSVSRPRSGARREARRRAT